MKMELDINSDEGDAFVLEVLKDQYFSNADYIENLSSLKERKPHEEEDLKDYIEVNDALFRLIKYFSTPSQFEEFEQNVFGGSKRIIIVNETIFKYYGIGMNNSHITVPRYYLVPASKYNEYRKKSLRDLENDSNVEEITLDNLIIEDYRIVSK